MLRGDGGILVQARNGVVIAYDDTGLTLRLSDTTLAELRDRLALTMDDAWIDPRVLGDIDAWGLRRQGDWLTFDAKLAAYRHPRRFRCPVGGGAILADTAGPLLGLFSLGGARRSHSLDRASIYPAHIVAPADDLGAGGAAGDPAPRTAGVQALPEVTADVLAAESYLAARDAESRAMPLIVARAEHDTSPTIDALLTGQALINVDIAMGNLVAAATHLGVSARLLGITLDFAIEDIDSDFQTYVDGVYGVADRLTDAAARNGLHAPTLLLHADATGHRTREHWHLAVFPAGRKIVVSLPEYAVDWTRQRRPSDIGLHRIGALEAACLDTLQAGEMWRCPCALLAEAAADELTRVEVTFDALSDLTVTQDGDAGFDCRDANGPVPILSVSPSDVDGKTLILQLDRPLDGAAQLSFAHGRPGFVRDAWQQDHPALGPLYRWALPAILAVH